MAGTSGRSRNRVCQCRRRNEPAAAGRLAEAQLAAPAEVPRGDGGRPRGRRCFRGREVSRAHETVLSALGAVDSLANNARPSQTGKFENIADAVWQADLDGSCARLFASRAWCFQAWGSGAAGMALTGMGARHNVLVNAFLMASSSATTGVCRHAAQDGGECPTRSRGSAVHSAPGPNEPTVGRPRRHQQRCAQEHRAHPKMPAHEAAQQRPRHLPRVLGGGGIGRTAWPWWLPRPR